MGVLKTGWKKKGARRTNGVRWKTKENERKELERGKDQGKGGRCNSNLELGWYS